MDTGYTHWIARAGWAKAFLGGLLVLGSGTAAVAQAPLEPLRMPQPVLLPQTVPDLGAYQQGWVDPGWAQGSGPGGAFWDTVRQSVCGCNTGLAWKPLCWNAFGDGWREPWVDPGPGSSGAVRQPWINTFEGFFARDAYLTYSFTNRLAHSGQEHQASVVTETPLSQRLWLGVEVPYLVSHQGGHGPSTTHFGDVLITPKVLLHETQDVSISAGLTVRVPTGDRITAGDRTELFPFVAFWTDVGRGISVRGGTGVDVPFQSRSPDATYEANLAVGKTFTCHEVRVLGDFTPFLSANFRQPLGGADEHSFFSLTPGCRTHLAREWYFSAGYEIPLVGPKPFDERLTFWLVKGW